MNTATTLFLLVNALALLLLPVRWAALPLLVGACYMTLGQGVEVAAFHFQVIRLLIAVGLIRVLLRGERLAGTFNGLDWLMLAWGLWAMLSSLFHTDVLGTVVNRMGLVYNAFGIFFLLRIFCRSQDDVVHLCRITAILLMPLSAAMYLEHLNGANLFSVLGGVNEFSEVRNGVVRSQGPFAHPILAGSVGAACLPLMFVAWHKNPWTALFGAVACIVMVWTSASSGPVLSAAFAVAALAMWPMRRHMRLFRWSVVLGYVALDLVMKAPAYYLLARVDLTGNSTSWHRARLIEAAIEHFSEWGLAGTDFTRHWMDYGVGWSPSHVDITNYYIMMGVYGGFLLMLLFIAVLGKGFAYVGRMAAPYPERGAQSAFVMWALGAALFAHAATFVSVSYFDQSVVFLYLALAAICGGYEGASSSDAVQASPVNEEPILSPPLEMQTFGPG